MNGVRPVRPAIHFPRPLKDEMLCSILSRYSHIEADEGVVAHLTGRRYAQMNADFPHDLNRIARSLPDEVGLSSDSMLAEHTMLPYFAPFMPQERAAFFAKAMKEECAFTPALTRPCGGTIRFPAYLSVCPVCCRIEEADRGFATWHRTFQLPGVFKCPLHGTVLHATDRPRHGGERLNYLPGLAFDYGRDAVNPTDLLNDGGLIDFVATETGELLARNWPSPGIDALQLTYKLLLREKGLLSSGGYVEIARLVDGIRSRCSDHVLSLMHSPLVGVQSGGWLGAGLRKNHGTQHPLRHLILLHYLRVTVSEFLERSYSSLAPQRQAPARDRLMNPRQQEHCRFVRARRHLLGMWPKKDISINRMALRLKVRHGTIVRWAVMAGLPFPRGETRAENLRKKIGSHVRLFPAERRDRRKEWLTALAQHSAPTIHCPGLYSWLLRNDAGWLDRHRAASKEPPRFDWASRDAYLAPQIEATATALKSERPTRRAAITTILRRLKCVSLFRNADGRLPLTDKALSRHAESAEEFFFRRRRSKFELEGQMKLW